MIIERPELYLQAGFTDRPIRPEREYEKRYLIHWNAAEAKQKVALLKKAGYDVTYEPLTPTIFREIRKKAPDAFVIDLSRLPSHGRDVALNIRQGKATRKVPLVFVEGDPEKVRGFQQHLPDAVYTSWSRIRSSLKQAISHPPQDPVVPASVLAGYADAPLQKKLGVKAGMRLALIDPPVDFNKTLGELPENISFTNRPNAKCDLILWFAKSQRDLNFGIRAVAQAMTENSSLWICWPKKGSGTESDLSQPVIRKIGLSNGLVDFKVCSIDNTWSGLKFRGRRPK